MRAEEDGKCDGYIVVKVNPRTYDISTTPCGTWRVELSLVVKSDVDYNGQTFDGVADQIINKVGEWQVDIYDLVDNIKFSGFEPTGITITDSNVSTDREDCVFTMELGLNIQAVIGF